MKSLFPGFSSAANRAVPMPLEVFTNLLSDIDDVNQWKVMLYFFWFISRLEQNVKYVSLNDFLADEKFLAGFKGNKVEKESKIKSALDTLVESNYLLRLEKSDSIESPLFFLNSKEGRASMTAVQKKYFKNGQKASPASTLNSERSNIFDLYERNIGPLTPLIAETLQDAEKTYPVEWVAEAIEAAVKNNVRRWKYIEAILKRWKEEGRYEKDRRGLKDDRKKYVKGEFGDLIEH